MAAPAIPPIRLGLIGTGPAAVHHIAKIRDTTHTTASRGTGNGHRVELVGFST